MSDVRVRNATSDDWPAVAALLAELGRPTVLGGPKEAAHRAAFAEYLERDDALCFVAVDGETVIGFCDLEFRRRLNFLSPMAWIPDLIVTEAARSRGAGAAMLARAEEEARTRGARWMELESANWRVRAHQFYLREGWADTSKAFTKPLAGQQWPPPPPE